MPKRPEQIHSDHQIPMPPVKVHKAGANLKLGADLFQRNCSTCHTNAGGAGIPDLRKMSAQTHAEFLDIVLKGIRAEKGMGNFSEILSQAEAESIHDYLIDLAWKAYTNTHKQPASHEPDA